MSVIGHFILGKDGGWTGTIRTLVINAKVRLTPNDNREHDSAPAFRVFLGASRIGDAWEAQAASGHGAYLRVRLDDPSLTEPLTAALFPSDDGASAQLVWTRR
ncbi:DUF736 domain-containing protein [Nitrospirillum iridis]|uniref:Uncharacterized protein (DUF736 family) n=1 Tax=Nitrospirillum iridis TaxID=765888 RepID=A0A7X0B5M2_9PROT|nr:DUF736 family protein [Nitrospirillum iridis]MBB6255431.1 uncharacterized protein (DUF736 family) [Nitrospirillum iridis]